MNHINSTKRPSLQNRSPYELIDSDDEDMHLLMKLMSMDDKYDIKIVIRLFAMQTFFETNVKMPVSGIKKGLIFLF